MVDNIVTRGDFARRLCVELGLEATFAQRVAIVSWERAEGTAARFNPLATTWQLRGSTDFNSVGVQNFLSMGQGLKATVLTLQQDRFANIVDALNNGTARAILAAVADSEWGTGDLALACLPSTRDDYERFAAEPIGQ
jgi:hypothetical protein